MKTTYKILFATVLALGLALSTFGQADTLKDLVGSRAGAAESDLESRGYALNHTSKEESAVWTYWWNSSKKKCVMVKTDEGRYVRINDAEPADCGQKSGLSTGQKVAIALAAAAAVGGTAAIVHKAHHHDDDKHFEDANQESDYERGFRDGQYNSTYHNWNNSTQYSSGYSAGVRQRREETSHSSGWGGYQPHQYVNDLVGSRASGAESSMQQRGFSNKNTFKMGDASYQIWWNTSTRQCIQVIVSDGRYESVKDIGSSPYCR
ncbi:MAG TPA: hypothetical protein PLP21_17450 [Pyrinomonadaceae bacterium]|nr:hypothetical protein [Acidobacteriota bacterium]HQZ98111.1 hypothetical protein [Pyrinomonadaceae bacterium]